MSTVSRPWAALALFAVFAGVNFGLRMWRHLRTTGSTGFVGAYGRVGSVEWLGGALFALSMPLALAAPLAQLSGLLAGPARPWSLPVDGLALALVALGIAGTTWAQSSMGASWRIGVRAGERTELIQQGPFRWVRNPIYSFMLITGVGLALFLPNVLTLAALASAVLGVELHVRFAEEPHLRAVHGDAYLVYCRKVGRFVPGIGRSGS